MRRCISNRAEQPKKLGVSLGTRHGLSILTKSWQVINNSDNLIFVGVDALRRSNRNFPATTSILKYSKDTSGCETQTLLFLLEKTFFMTIASL